MKDKTEERLLERMEAKWNSFEDMSWSVKEACRWIHRETKKEDLEKKKEQVERLKNWLFISNNESFKDFAIQMNEIIDEIFGDLKKEIKE